MIIIMEHKPKTIYISTDNKRHAICEACKVRKTILAIYFYYLQKYDPSYNILNVSEKLPVNHIQDIGQYLVHSERRTADTPTLNFMA